MAKGTKTQLETTKTQPETLKKRNEEMPEKSSTNLPVPITNLAIATVDVASMAEKIREVSPEGLNVFDLDRVSFPTAGSLTFNVPTAEGPEPRRYIDGIIVHQHASRQLFETEYDATKPSPPRCVSFDGITGYGDPGGECAACPFATFGGTCRPSRFLYILQPDELFPMLLILPRTSLSRKLQNGVSRYFFGLAKGGKSKVKGGLHMFSVITRIGLAQRQNGLGMVATFTEGPMLTHEQIEQVQMYAKAFRESLVFPRVASENGGAGLPPNLVGIETSHDDDDDDDDIP